MKPSHGAACARCGKAGQPYQLNDLLEQDESQPCAMICDQCMELLVYADARAWRWFRKYRDRLISSHDK